MHVQNLDASCGLMRFGLCSDGFLGDAYFEVFGMLLSLTLTWFFGVLSFPILDGGVCAR